MIRAAEKIFARDGFEAAKLEEIAAEAGYTRGAFYANFDSKEDLFFALLEGEISSRINTVEQHDAQRSAIPKPSCAPFESSSSPSARTAAGACLRWNSNCSRCAIPR